jgi:aldehyde dehydrogenase (NAD+)
MEETTMSNLQRFYIGGQWVDPAAPAFRDVINPATEAAAGSVAMGSAADVERAVAASTSSRASAWPTRSATTTWPRPSAPRWARR